MEKVRKTKRSKKRRYVFNNIKLDEFTQEMQSQPEESINVNINLETEEMTNMNSIKKNQTVQTENSNILESTENETLLIEKDEQIKCLTEKLQKVTSKLYESKNAYTFLKQDFKKAQKLLCSEIGENVTIAGLSNQPGGWRGRAEQIQQLQQKLLESQQKLSDIEGSRRKSLERRSTSSIRVFDKEKKQQIESLTKDLKETESTLENTKKKLEAAKARITVLENDLNTSKRTITLLNEKTHHDNQLIEALHNQSKEAETKFQNREVAIKRQNEKFEREIVLLKSELEAVHIHMKNFKRQMDEKDKEIENLKSGGNIAETITRSQHGNEQSSSEIVLENHNKDANEYIAIGIAAEAERERLLEFVAVLNQRLDKERNEYEQISNSLKKERNRAAKLETKLQKMELERVGLSRINTGSYKLRAPKLTVKSNSELSDPDEFRLKFELLEEECLTLKTRLVTLQKERASDIATFKKMLEQTRSVFKDACRGKLPVTAIYSNITI